MPSMIAIALVAAFEVVIVRFVCAPTIATAVASFLSEQGAEATLFAEMTQPQVRADWLGAPMGALTERRF